MANSKRPLTFYFRNAFLYFVIGLLIDSFFTCFFFLFDFLEIHNVSFESIFNPSLRLVKSVFLLYCSVFLPAGLLITTLLLLAYFLYQEDHKIKKFFWIKADFIVVTWFLLLFPRFLANRVSDLFGFKLKPYTGIVVFVGVAFLVYSLFALYFRRRTIKMPLYVFRLLLALIVLPILFSLAKSNLSLSGSSNIEMSQATENADRKDSEDLNVLLITIDACRADKLSCYGFNMPTSTNIDRFAENSFLFEYAFSAANWTRPATASLFTSVYPATHQTNVLVQQVPASLLCLPERFKKGGYRTAVFSANPNVSPDFGFNQGVDYFYETSSPTMLTYSALFRSLVSYSEEMENILRKFENTRTISENIEEEEAIYNSFFEWVRTIGQDKFFAYIHFNTPHSKYNPPHAYDVFAEDSSIAVGRNVPRKGTELTESQLNRLLSLYYGEIYYVDFIIGKILDEFEKSGLLDKTVVVITSDHGEEFYDHQGWGHARTLFNELLHIPLIFYVPNTSHPPGRIKNYASIIDIGPTLLSLAGLPGDSFMDGKDLTPLFRGDEKDVHDFIIAQHINSKIQLSQTTIIKNGLKYTQTGIKPKKKKSFLYDLTNDFGEIEQLSFDSTPLHKELRKSLARMNWYTLGKKISSKKVQLSDEKREQLKALGYIE